MGHSRLNRMKHYVEMVLKEPALSNANKVETRKTDKCVIGYIRAENTVITIASKK